MNAGIGIIVIFDCWMEINFWRIQMRNERIREKVQIFISSSCDTKYKTIRRALKLLLLETNLCDVYVFEDECGSTQNVETTYMEPLERSELCIIIIDNKDNVTDATLKEINRARELKKKCLFVFCDETTRKRTKLQEELTAGLNERYMEVHEFSQIPEKAYESVVREIVSIYHTYCRGKYEKSEIQEITTISEELIASESKYIIKRNLTKGYEYTKHVLHQNIMFAIEDTKAQSNLDKICATILDVVLGNRIFDEINFIGLKDELHSVYTEQIFSVIEKRVDAMEAYWKGEIQKSIFILSDCIDSIQVNDEIPNWLRNDIAIDLRNLQRIEDIYNNKMDFAMKGQKILDESEEPIYFPVLDRCIATYNEQIAKNNISDKLDSPYTVRMGGLEYITDKLCDAFVISIIYGSITHSTMLRTRLQLLLSGACVEYKEHKMFIILVKQLLLDGNHGELKKFLRSYGEYTDNINSDDVDVLVEAIDRINIPYRKFVSKILLLQNFGYYFSDEKYKSFTDSLIIEICNWIEKPFAMSMVGNCVFDSLKRNIYRMDLIKILSICYKVFQHKKQRWYNDIFDIINQMPLDTITREEQRECIDWIISCIEDENIRQQCNILCNAVQNIRFRCKVKQKTLDNKVKKYMPDFYESTYSLNILNHDKDELWKYIKDYIKFIITDNETQGINGTYIGHGINPYKTIRNIMCFDKVLLNSVQIEELLNAIKETVLAEKQLTSAKVDALELLTYLKITYPDDQNINIVLNSLREEYHVIIQSNDDFMNNSYTVNSIKLAYELIKLVTNNSDFFTMIEILSDMQQEIESVKITSLAILERFFSVVDLSSIENEALRLLVEYILNLSKSNERDTRFHAGIALLLLLDTDYRKLVLNRVSNIMNGDTFENKVSLLSRLGKKSIEDELVEYIFQKGKVDNNFWVRKIAQRYANN